MQSRVHQRLESRGGPGQNKARRKRRVWKWHRDTKTRRMSYTVAASREAGPKSRERVALVGVLSEGVMERGCAKSIFPCNDMTSLALEEGQEEMGSQGGSWRIV